MSVVSFLGEIQPWPVVDTPLPEGWSWGPTPDLARIAQHKSRMIVQADAIAGSVAPDAAAKRLQHALYRGAAEWELWLLTQHHEAPLDERQQRAHSALTLAELAGDGDLVGQVLAAWSAIGPTHARFYREGLARQTTRRRPTTVWRARFQPLLDAVLRDADPQAASNLLDTLNHDPSVLWTPAVFAMRARALDLLHAAPTEIAAARFEGCIASPLSPNAMCAYLLTLSRLQVRPPGADTFIAGLAWFGSDLNVQATALWLRDSGAPDSLFATPEAEHLDSVMRLARTSADPSDADEAVFVCVKRMLREGSRRAEALALIDDTLQRHPTAPVLGVFRDLIAFELGRADAFERLIAIVHDPTRKLPAWLWLVAGEVLVRGERWRDAVIAFERGQVMREAVLAPRALNQYALALARIGNLTGAHAALALASTLAPGDPVVRNNLALLQHGDAEALTSIPFDAFALLDRHAGDRYEPQSLAA